MSDNPDERLSTIPRGFDKPKEKELLKQIPVRLHIHDHTMLMAMLKKDRMSLQKFISICVRAYLDGDPMMLKCVKNYRELEVVPREIKERHVLSHRERAHIFDELEKLQKEGE